MLTSLVLLLVVRVAWAKPGKLKWKYNSVPQCPPVTRAVCAGLWLILAIATFYSAFDREAAGVGSLPKRRWRVVAGARRRLAVPALSALCCSLMLAIHSLDPGRLGSRRAVGPGWCEMSPSGVPRGLAALGRSLCASPAARCRRPVRSRGIRQWPTSPSSPSLASFSAMLELAAAAGSLQILRRDRGRDLSRLRKTEEDR